MDDLLKYQDELQEEGKDVLDDLGLLDFLSRFSTPHIVGSLTSGLMTWRDIDIELYKQPDENDMWDTAHFLFGKEHVRSVWEADYRKRTDSPFPKGLYIGVKYQKEIGKKWKIDLWFMPKRDTPDYHAWVMDKLPSLTQEKKLSILKLKSMLAAHPQYRKQIFSIDIYKAVIEEDVHDIDSFKNYLKKTNRMI